MITELASTDFAAWKARAQASYPAAPPVVLDVREQWELEIASISPDGFTLVHVPLAELPIRLQELRASYEATQPIACLCHHGMRSLRAADFLAEAGFTAVINLRGGIDAWARRVDRTVATY